ncbi:hypothetical protein CDL60_15385 [Roseateles noduli]|nr:hypothetical protein CDL60_15385 [Roseateles noduli]
MHRIYAWLTRWHEGAPPDEASPARTTPGTRAHTRQVQAFCCSADALLQRGEALPPTATPRQRFQQMRDEVVLMKDAMGRGVSLFSHRDEDAARRSDALLKLAEDQLARTVASLNPEAVRRLDACCAESRSLLQAARDDAAFCNRDSIDVEVMFECPAPDVAPGNLLKLRQAFGSLHDQVSGAIRKRCATACRDIGEAMGDPECLDRFQRLYAELLAQRDQAHRNRPR